MVCSFLLIGGLVSLDLGDIGMCVHCQSYAFE